MTVEGRGGRPPMNEPGQTKRSPISMRVTPALRARLDASAAANGLSLAQEVERRIEASCDYADAADYLGRHFDMRPKRLKNPIEDVAGNLTGPQRECILAIRPGEKRRATCFSGEVARNLCAAKGSRPALLTRESRRNGTNMWYGLTEEGVEVFQMLRSGIDTTNR
jgi:hypothetical protein